MNPRMQRQRRLAGLEAAVYARYVANGVGFRMAGFFQKRGKAAMRLSGLRIDPAHDRSWVGRRMTALRRNAQALALAGPKRGTPG